MNGIVNKSIRVNAILNVIKQACGIVFPMVTFPYVARTMGLDRFGQYSFAESVVGYFSVFAMLGVTTYAVREGAGIRNKQNNINQFATEILIINSISFLISIAALIVLTLFVPRLFEERVLILILSFNVFANVIGRDWVNTVYEDYKYLTIRYIVIHIISLCLIFASIKNPDDYLKYTVIMVLTNSTGLILNVLYIRKYVRIVKISGAYIKRHIKPILVLFFVSIVTKVYISSDITILGFMVDNESLGIYSMSSKVYLLIKALVNAAIMVVVPRVSMYINNNENGKAKHLLGATKDLLFVVVIPLIVGIQYEATEIMNVICGTQYSSDGMALRILCVALFFAVFACYYAHSILIPLRKEKYFAIATFISVVINVVLNILLIPIWGINAAALTTLLSELVVAVLCKFFSGEFNINVDINLLIVSLLGGGVSLGVCFVIDCFSLSPIIDIITSFTIAVMLYAFICFRYKDRLTILWSENENTKRVD